MFFKKKEKTLTEYLNETKKIKINGIIFKIKKIDPMAHLQGINALQQVYQTYTVNNRKKIKFENLKDGFDAAEKIKKVVKDILLAGVVSPTLSAKPDGSGVYVEEIFKDMILAQKLAEKIIEFTYKKKLMNRYG